MPLTLAIASAALGAPIPPPPPPDPRCANPVYRCPDLRMRAPTDLRITRTPRGRMLLWAANQIYSLGAGPLSLRGRRRDRETMWVRQRIYTVNGNSVSVPRPGARIAWKHIPGQGGYWKFKDAAAFEIRELGTGALVRTGEKAVYCFRDLKRTHPSRRSPTRRVNPGCNRNPRARFARLGTSIGWADIYPNDYYEQYIDVTGLRGCFGFWHVVDPGNHLIESNESNNRGRTVVRLPSGRPGRC